MAPKKYTSWALSLMMALGMFVVSCSDETQESTSPVTTIDLVPTDTVPPTLRNVTPRNGLANVAISTNLTLEFSEALDADTLITNDTATCAGSVHLSATDFVSCVPLQDPQATLDNQSFTIRPVNSLDYDQTYRLKLTSDIRDEAGNRLVVDDNDTEQIISVFTTAADATVPLSAELLSKLELDLLQAARYSSRSQRTGLKTLALQREQILSVVEEAQNYLIDAELWDSEDIPSVLDGLLTGAMIGLENQNINASIRRDALGEITSSLTSGLAGKNTDFAGATQGLLTTGVVRLAQSNVPIEEQPEAIAGLTLGIIRVLDQLSIENLVPTLIENAVEIANTAARVTLGFDEFWVPTFNLLGEIQVEGMSNWAGWSNLEEQWSDSYSSATYALLASVGNVERISASDAEQLFGEAIGGFWQGWKNLTVTQEITVQEITVSEVSLAIGKTVVEAALGQNQTEKWTLDLISIALRVQQETQTVLEGNDRLATIIAKLNNGISAAVQESDEDIPNLDTLLNTDQFPDTIGPNISEFQYDNLTNTPSASFQFNSDEPGEYEVTGCGSEGTTGAIIYGSNVVTLGSLKDDNYTCEISFVDYFGNQSTDNLMIEFQIDTKRPVVELTSPQAGSTYYQTEIDLEWSGSDEDEGSGLLGYYVSEGNYSSADGDWKDNTTYSYNIENRQSGVKTIYVWAKDKAGNISNPATIEVVLALPEATIVGKNIGTTKNIYDRLDGSSLSIIQDNSSRFEDLHDALLTRVNRLNSGEDSESKSGSLSNDNITVSFQDLTGDDHEVDLNDNRKLTISASSEGPISFDVDNVKTNDNVTITRLDENGNSIPSSKITLVVKDNLEPHVAIQNNNYRGQDTLISGLAPGVGDNDTPNSLNNSEMLVEFEAASTNLPSKDEQWDLFFFYPKFNLSASMYDKSGFRSLADSYSSGTTIAEDSVDDNDTRVDFSERTPLLAINSGSGRFPSFYQEGRTASGRSDQFYTASDYTAWASSSETNTINLMLTEPVTGPSSLSGFATTLGALSQNNIPDGELLDNITGITEIKSSDDQDYLQITFGDWRTIDASQHFTDRSQTVVANTEYEGISKESLLQIVGLTDLAGNAATAGNARGVVFVDATPPLATSAIVRDTGDSVELTIAFDQLVRGTDNFTLQGSGVTYTFNNNTVTRSSTESGSVFDNTTNTNTASYNVSGQGTSTLTITIPDSGTSDFSNFFSALSHDSTGSTNGTPGNTPPSFYLAYDNITDLNYNSWSKVEYYDAYVTNGNGPSTDRSSQYGPRLIGTDQLLPKIQAASVNDNASQTFLMEVTDHGLSIVSAFGTGAYDGSDLKGVGLIYSAGTTADGTDVNNTTDNATTAINRDYPLYRFWNAADASESLDNQSNNNNTPVRAVIRFSEGTALSGSGSAYIRAILDSGDNATVDNASTETALLRKSIRLTSDANAGTTVAGDFSVKDNYLVVGIPDYTSGSGAGKPDKSSVDTDDVLVIDGVISGGVEYVLHISPPAVASADSGTTLSESNNPDLQVFRKVHLDVDLAALKAEYKASDTDLLSGQNMSFQFLENINSVSGITYTAPTTINNSDPSFKVLGMNSSAESADNETASFTLKSSELSGSGLDNIVGDGATLAFTATDFSGNANTYTIAFKLGHNQTDNQTNINDLEGSHIVPILNEISSTANSGNRRLQAP